MTNRAVLYGPGFQLELDNYRFSATTAAQQRAARSVQRARELVGARAPQPHEPQGARPTHPLEELPGAHPTHPLEEVPVARPAWRPPEPRPERTSWPALVPGETRPRVTPHLQPTRRFWRLPGGLGRRPPDGA